MFFYRFSSSFSTNIVSSPDQGSKPGDLLYDGETYFLNLGEDIAWSEQGYENYAIKPYDSFKSLCTLETLELMHWMVHERYSSYNNIIPLWLGKDIHKLLHYKTSSASNPGAQTLIVFPSIFALEHYRSSHTLSKDTEVLIGSSTLVQKGKAYRSISQGHTKTLLCTHSQIFQNRRKLTTIRLMDEHSSYYRSFKDPRYRIKDVVLKMRHIYNTQ